MYHSSAQAGAIKNIRDQQELLWVILLFALTLGATVRYRTDLLAFADRLSPGVGQWWSEMLTAPILALRDRVFARANEPIRNDGGLRHRSAASSKNNLLAARNTPEDMPRRQPIAPPSGLRSSAPKGTLHVHAATTYQEGMPSFPAQTNYEQLSNEIAARDSMRTNTAESRIFVVRDSVRADTRNRPSAARLAALSTPSREPLLPALTRTYPGSKEASHRGDSRPLNDVRAKELAFTDSDGVRARARAFGELKQTQREGLGIAKNSSRRESLSEIPGRAVASAKGASSASSSSSSSDEAGTASSRQAGESRPNGEDDSPQPPEVETQKDGSPTTASQSALKCSRSGGQEFDSRIIPSAVASACKKGGAEGGADVRCSIIDGANGWLCQPFQAPRLPPGTARNTNCHRMDSTGQIVDSRILTETVVNECKKGGKSGESDSRCAIIDGANGWVCSPSSKGS